MITESPARRPKCAWAYAGAFVIAMTCAALNAIEPQGIPRLSLQERYATGQNIAPAFEGWEENPDGTFNMVFGYFNRNWEEQPDVPIGPNNYIEPGSQDQGQPTHFFPRRNKFVFRVRVPKDFGNKDLVWSLTVNGKTEKAYGTLKPDYLLEKAIIQTNASMRGGGGQPEMEKNVAPVVRVDGATRRTAKVGEPLDLTAFVTDDGIPKASPAPFDAAVQDTTAMGLRVAWFVYRGPGDKVKFEPEQFKIYQDKREGGNSPWTPGWNPPALPRDGRFPVKVTFNTPGVFVLRVMAHDGGLDSTQDVTVTVTP